MPVIEIPFDLIDPNPYRDAVVNPPSAGQIEALKDSIELTSFWDGLLVRKHPTRKGRYQLAFGHSRLDAAKLHGLTRANFNVVELDDGKMIQHLGVENFTQRGHDEYALYREVVTAAIEHLMREAISDSVGPPGGRRFFKTEVLNGIRAGGMPGREVLGQFFGGVLSQKAIRMVLEEYKDTGKLAAWHARHNPKAGKRAEPATLNPEALGKFNDTAHVKTFADTVRHLRVAPAEQPALADAVLSKLKTPTPQVPKTRTAENQRLAEQWARTDQPRHERLTSSNIRSEAHKAVSDKRRTSRERDALRAEAHAISIEGSMTEMSIGLRRAANAASDIMRVAEAIGGLRVDLTPSAQLSLGQCVKAVQMIERSLRAAARHGVRIPLMGA